MMGRAHVWQRRSILASVLVAITAMFSCHGCPPPPTPTPDGGDGGTAPDSGFVDAGPLAVEVADGNFWNAYSGIAYADAGGTVLHAIVGEAVTPSSMTQPALGDLDVIRLNPPFTTKVTTDHLAYVDAVVVSPAPPERFLFLDNYSSVGVGTGTLMMGDLSNWHPPLAPLTTQLTSAGVTGFGVTASSFFFGQNGAEILFIDEFQSTTLTGTLTWTDGNGNFQVLGTGATTAALVLSADRSHALAAVHIGATSTSDGGSVDSDLGDLVWIDLATGKSTLVASSITALPHEHYCPATLCTGPTSDCGVGCQCVTNVADGGETTGPQFYCACAQPPPCSYLNQSLEPMFSVSADGSSVAYEAPNGTNYTVSVATLSGGIAKSTAIGAGQFPGLSGDGQLVAYFDPFLDGGTSALEIRDSMANPIVSTPAVGVAPPRFSPDNAFLAFSKNFRIQGTQLNGEISDVWLIQPTDAGVAVNYAQKAAWRSLAYWPATGATEQISVLTNVVDPSGQATLTNGTGSLLVDNPISLFGTGATASAGVALNLHPEDFGLLPASGGFAVSENGLLEIWAPATSTAIRRPGSLTNLQKPVGAGTLQTSAAVMGLATDEIAFLSSVTGVANGQEQGPLFGGTPAQITELMEGKKTNVVQFTLTPDGRVLAIVQDTSSLAEVWLLPL